MTERTLSIDYSGSAHFPTVWVVTDEYGFSGKVVQVTGQTAAQAVRMTLKILAANPVDRIVVRADGVGGAFADLLYQTNGLHIPVLLRYPAGSRTVWETIR